MRIKPIIIFSIIIAVSYFFVGLITIYDYGINWDEPSHYIRGQAYLRFFLTGKGDYKDLPKIKDHYPINVFGVIPKEALNLEDSPYRRSIYQYDSEKYNLTFQYYLKHDSGHPPLNGILASFTNYLFYQRIGILGDIEGYHIFTILVSSILVSAVFLFTSRNYGIFAGFVAALTLALYPIFFAESHFNIKDPVVASFYTITIVLFYFGITKENWKLITLSAFFAGTALGTKLNIIFAAIPIAIWFFAKYAQKIGKGQWPLKKSVTIALIFYPIFALGVVFLSWPYLWQDPVGNTNSILLFYKKIGLTDHFDTLLFNFINTYAIQWVIYTTPVLILFFSLFGVIYSIKNISSEKNKTSILILLWFITPIIRVSLPQANIYGGIRQIMEYIPAMAILSGIGAKYIVSISDQYLAQRFKLINSLTFKQFHIKPILTLQALAIFLFVPIIFKLISLHPNQNVYFNSLMGGLRGAYEKDFPDWGATLGSVYKQGSDWLNTNAEKNAKLVLVRGLLSNVPRITLREDIRFSDKYYSAEGKEGEYIMEIYNYQWKYDIPEVTRSYLETLKPVFELKVENVPLLIIWKNDSEHTISNI